jgi:hypothetical protein
LKKLDELVERGNNYIFYWDGSEKGMLRLRAKRAAEKEIAERNQRKFEAEHPTITSGMKFLEEGASMMMLDEGVPMPGLSSMHEATTDFMVISGARRDAGTAFNIFRRPYYQARGGVNELYINLPNGRYVVLDSYIPNSEIVSRKFTQLSEIAEADAIEYLNELALKYAPGRIIRAGGSSGALAGQPLVGKMILEVPVQQGQIPGTVLNAARTLRISIRDINGVEY